MNLGWHVRRFLFRSGVRLIKASGRFASYWHPWRGRAFEETQRDGLHILPVHYYSPVPDTEALPRSLWAQTQPTPGVELDIEEGFALLEELAEGFRDEYTKIATRGKIDGRFHIDNPAFSRGSAEVLYAMIRKLRPKRILEIGSGHTTLLFAEAIERISNDDDSPCAMTCIEPYPPDYLSPPPPQVSRFISDPLQTVEQSTFDELEAGDFLFIDSTHVVNIGSDVVYEYLHILPRLAPGVIVHIHDIFIPHEYPEDWIRKKRFFWNEQYLLQAFLSLNDAYEVILPLHAMSRADPERFGAAIPSCAGWNGHPSSFWIRRKT